MSGPRDCGEARHVVVAGDGVAAVEAVLALHALARERICVTLVAPQQPSRSAPRTAIPFAQATTKRLELSVLIEHCGAELVQDSVATISSMRAVGASTAASRRIGS